jgi:hypothetical protein
LNLLFMLIHCSYLNITEMCMYIISKMTILRIIFSYSFNISCVCHEHMTFLIFIKVYKFQFTLDGSGMVHFTSQGLKAHCRLWNIVFEPSGAEGLFLFVNFCLEIFCLGKCDLSIQTPASGYFRSAADINYTDNKMCSSFIYHYLLSPSWIDEKGIDKFTEYTIILPHRDVFNIILFFTFKLWLK